MDIKSYIEAKLYIERFENEIIVASSQERTMFDYNFNKLIRYLKESHIFEYWISRQFNLFQTTKTDFEGMLNEMFESIWNSSPLHPKMLKIDGSLSLQTDIYLHRVQVRFLDDVWYVDDKMSSPDFIRI